MMGKEHTTFATITTVSTCIALSNQSNIAGFEYPIVTVITAIVGSLAPDICSPTSTVGRLFPHISRFISKHFGHRTITHDILLWSLIAVVLYYFFPMTIGFFIGYLGHLFLDSLTINGICWGYLFFHKYIRVPAYDKEKQLERKNLPFVLGGFHLLPLKLRCAASSTSAVVLTYCLSAVVCYGWVHFYLQWI